MKKLKAEESSEDTQLAETVRASAQQIWQAGLGAFAKAQEEGGKVFAKLVREGTDLQKRTQKLAEDKVFDVTGTVTRVADSVGKQAAGSWDKLERVFEDRVSRSLKNLGVPTRHEMQILAQRVEELTALVESLEKKGRAPRASGKTSSRKPASKITSQAASPATTRKPAPRSTTKRSPSKTGA